MHMEGAEAIGPDLDALYLFYDMGLRSLGPVWSRPTVFGHGVPFKFPGDPDTGPGLTDAGKDLVRLCNALGIMIDLSHMNQAGFEDVARLSTAPLVATHSNVHALCASPRNLTDRQLDQIRESGGMVGLNFAVGFLREDGMGSSDTGLDVDGAPYRLPRRASSAKTTSGWARTSTAAPCPTRSRTSPACRSCSTRWPTTATTRRCSAKLAHENWLACLERTLRTGKSN